ncbi:MAG TPA: transporter substrate-binding domain-containing protein [Kofleriaceae bacterium]|nr:transporter substrate-binding domain-containing protein [Kofleriaceae bacterium]
MIEEMRSRPARFQSIWKWAGRAAAALAALIATAAASEGAARATCAPGARDGAGVRLRVGFAPLAPFVLPPGTDGVVRGFAVELLRTLARKRDWSLDLVELAPDTLNRRVADCEVDVGVVGVPVSASLADAVDFSQTFLVTVTTAVVHRDDLDRAGPSAGISRGGRIARAVLRGLVWGLVALVLLALSAWLLNATSRRRGRLAVRWRRADPSVGGPLAGMRWLWRSATGRILVALWVGAGLVLGTTGWTGGAVEPLRLGDDPLRALIEEASHTETLVGERIPDGDHVSCSGEAAKACFRGFAEGALAAVAGPRDVVCSHVLDLGLDDVVLRDDLAVSERYAFLLPPASPLRLELNRAILEMHAKAGPDAPLVPCPGDPR